MSATAPPLKLFRPSGRVIDLIFCGAACGVFLLCILLAWPFAQSAFDDDWSYAFVAYNLHKTGHLQYSGWGSPMVLFQSAWGSLWSNIFGFSFNVLRLATLPFSLGFVAGVYALARKAGLAPAWAALGAGTVTLSPLYLPLAASFMTEPYSCFFTVVCLYAALAAADSERRVPAVLWLYLLLVAGILGGSSRQTVWTAPVALIPYLAFRKRTDRMFVAQAAVAFVLCLAALFYCSLHFTQPYAPLQLPARQLVQIALHGGFWALVGLFLLSLAGLQLAWPALLCLAPQWNRLSRPFVIAALLGSAVFCWMLWRWFGDAGVIPYVGNLFSSYGILYIGQDGLGFRPKLLQNRYMLALSTALLVSALATFRIIRGRPATLRRNVREVFLLSALAYLPLLLPGALLGFLFDRYTLPLLPLVVIWVLWHAQSASDPGSAIATLVPGWYFGALLLLVFAGYGTAVTHDYYAALRARGEAAQKLEAQGVARNQISAGFEYDGWTQIQTAGHLRAVAYRDHPHWNTTSTFWFWTYATALHPDYLAITKVWPGSTVPKAVVEVPYQTWLAPHLRYVGIWKRSDVPQTRPCVENSDCLDMDKPLASSRTGK